MLFRKGDSSNSKCKQRFKEKIDMLEAYNGGTLFANVPRDPAREVKLLYLDANRKDNVEKARTSERAEYLATMFLFSSDRCRYEEPSRVVKPGRPQSRSY